MARDGMGTLIADLRRMTDAGTADFTVAGEDYYADDTLQRHLDEYRSTIRRERLMTFPEYTGGSAIWKDYAWSQSHVEQYGTATPEAFNLEDSNGSAIGTSEYSVNYEARTIRFNNDTRGSAYYLSYRAYDMARVAATVWREKASFYSGRFDVQIDNHDLDRSQLREHAEMMEKRFLSMAKPRQGIIVRRDAN